MNTPTPAAAAPSAEAAAAVVLPDETKFAGRRAALLISTLLLGVLSFQLNASMVTPALPQIAASFGHVASDLAGDDLLVVIHGSSPVHLPSSLSGIATGTTRP